MVRGNLRLLPVLIAGLLLIAPGRANALDRICDPAYEDCRAPLLNLINSETVGIDVAFWFMEDTRYANAIVSRWRAGVPVRVLMDSEANCCYDNEPSLQMLRDAGIPMREKTGSGILHWKMMLFVGQNTVEFSGANYSSEAFVPIAPYSNYVDEIIYFTGHSSVVNSFKTRYDDQWVSTSGYSNYANVTSLSRKYPTYAIDPEMNFVPWNNFASRSVSSYNAEATKIDVIMYRITDRRHTDAMIAAKARGVSIRVISEPEEYRDATRLWHAWNIDRLYAAGIPIRHRAHAGLSHEKLTLLYGQGMTIFGSSNWTSASAESQAEHNIFTKDTTFFNWATAHFDRKWNNTAPGGMDETTAFVPLPPDVPSLKSPANSATGQPLSVTLAWWAGLWAHKYDVYFGTSPSSMTRILDDRELGPSQGSSDYVTWSVSNLAAGTTYYWYVVSRTMADMEKTSATFSFTTEGTGGGGGGGGPLPTGWSHADIGAVATAGNASFSSGTYTVEGSGADVWGNADELHFAYQSLTGDGTMTARVASVEQLSSWTKAGVMFRASLSAGAQHGFMMVTPGKGLAFQRRVSSGGATTHTSGAAVTAPYWVRISRTGSTIRAYSSPNGSTWTLVGTDTIAMPSTIFVGLAVSSHVDGSLATAAFDQVTVTAGGVGGGGGGPLPSGWSQADVGSTGAAGTGTYSAGTYTLQGAGADVWGTADQFHYAYHAMSGDGAVVARVASLENVASWTKAGVMIRSSLSAGAHHAFMLVSPGKGLAFQRRVSNGGQSTNTTGPGGAAPYWVRLQRKGDVFTASASTNGLTWTVVGTQTIKMPNSVLAGLAVGSHVTGSLATATFDQVTVTP
jgi:regulation of enolase protein 1 (concanavalin A-like superfamily)